MGVLHKKKLIVLFWTCAGLPLDAPRLKANGNAEWDQTQLIDNDDRLFIVISFTAMLSCNRGRSVGGSDQTHAVMSYTVIEFCVLTD